MWIRRRKKKAKAATAEKTGAPPVAKVLPLPPGPCRRQLPDGTVEEVSAATGRSILVPADPRPLGLDLRAGASGWERWRGFLARLRGG
jgi:hypothetical protein